MLRDGMEIWPSEIFLKNLYFFYHRYQQLLTGEAQRVYRY